MQGPLLWKENEEKEDLGFLLIDAKNAFNELNRQQMIWRIRFEWPEAARFVFNCYKHWSSLAVRNVDGSFFSIFLKEGVTQGDPISMHIYGIGVLPLVEKLK